MGHQFQVDGQNRQRIPTGVLPLCVQTVSLRVAVYNRVLWMHLLRDYFFVLFLLGCWKDVYLRSLHLHLQSSGEDLVLTTNNNNDVRMNQLFCTEKLLNVSSILTIVDETEFTKNAENACNVIEIEVFIGKIVCYVLKFCELEIMDSTNRHHIRKQNHHRDSFV